MLLSLLWDGGLGALPPCVLQISILGIPVLLLSKVIGVDARSAEQHKSMLPAQSSCAHLLVISCNGLEAICELIAGSVSGLGMTSASNTTSCTLVAALGCPNIDMQRLQSTRHE